jgi:hypothetical protein
MARYIPIRPGADFHDDASSHPAHGRCHPIGPDTGHRARAGAQPGAARRAVGARGARAVLAQRRTGLARRQPRKPRLLARPAPGGCHEPGRRQRARGGGHAAAHAHARQRQPRRPPAGGAGRVQRRRAAAAPGAGLARSGRRLPALPGRGRAGHGARPGRPAPAHPQLRRPWRGRPHGHAAHQPHPAGRARLGALAPGQLVRGAAGARRPEPVRQLLARRRAAPRGAVCRAADAAAAPVAAARPLPRGRDGAAHGRRLCAACHGHDQRADGRRGRRPANAARHAPTPTARSRPASRPTPGAPRVTSRSVPATAAAAAAPTTRCWPTAARCWRRWARSCAPIASPWSPTPAMPASTGLPTSPPPRWC